MPCSSCGSEKKFARGLCGGCYYRLRRRGTLARKNVKNFGFSCSIEGCDQPAVSKGFCPAHYQKQFHPLRNTWKLIRSRYAGETPIAWDRFETFLAEVGERPTIRHQLRRADDAKPYSASNVRWVKPVPMVDTYTKEQRGAYAKAWALQTKYKITSDDFDRMLAVQKGRCAICEEETGLHVDHCHAKGSVRGLLCVRCNRGLGYFKDKPELLKRAASYLAGK